MMRFWTILLLGAAAAPLFAAAPTAPDATATSIFDGVWAIDTGSMKLPPRPEVILLKDGVYSCLSCHPAYHIPADGLFHPLGDGSADEGAITIIDDHSVREVYRRKGRTLYDTTHVVSADGAHQANSSIITTTEVTRKGGGEQTRVAPAPAGAHAISGSWQTSDISVPPSDWNWVLKLDGRVFRFRGSGDTGYTAIVGGPTVRIAGDPDGRASVTMPRFDTIVESDAYKGEVGSVLTMQILPDGKTMWATAYLVKDHVYSTFFLHRQ